MPLSLIVPNKRLIFFLAILFATFINTSLIVDANFFAENRYHLSLLTGVLFNPLTYVLITVQFLVVLVFESMLANQLFSRLKRAEKKPLYGKQIAWLILICWGYVQGLHIWADATYYNAITGFTRYLPAYRPLHAKRDLARLGWIDSGKSARQGLTVPGNGSVSPTFLASPGGSMSGFHHSAVRYASAAVA